MWPLPASFPVEGGDLFLSFLSLPSLCMGVAAQSQQQCWISAPWVKAGLPAEEMLWKWDLLLLWRGTGYFRSRLCWRYGLGQDYCSCLREVLLYPELPSYQGDRHHKKKLSSSSVHLSLAWPLDSDMWFSQPQRSLMVYSNIRDQAHYLHLPKRIEFPHRFQITAEGKGCLAVSLRAAQRSMATQNSSSPWHV